ncbi:PDGLE domain-containing protein [Mumia sp. DW29H23]|uniref:PDGLE domain-containing protein n=1 Tax=Mumia sp. DW29H23 TaxID=3421241 RepID=UPI003D6923A1
MTARLTTRTFVVVSLVAALLVAGVVSFYASGHPDGLEYVAGTAGFLDSAHEHLLGGGPLAEYATAGVSDGRLSGGLAGVIGCAVVLVVAGGIGRLLRPRRDPQA